MLMRDECKTTPASGIVKRGTYLQRKCEKHFEIERGMLGITGMASKGNMGLHVATTEVR